MNVYFFRSELDGDVFGFTMDPRGTNLPDEFAPWKITSSVPTGHGIAKPVLEALECDSFYLMRVGPNVAAAPLSGAGH
jgi:hypothetical protein